VRTSDRELLAVGLFGGTSRLGERIEALLKRGREFSPRASRARVGVSALALLTLVVAGSFAPSWIAFAQTRAAFEVASVRPNKNGGQGRLRYNPMGIEFSSVPLSWVIGEAYHVAYNRISSSDPKDTLLLPKGTASFYDIAARAERATSQEQIRLMLQTMLAERFKLSLHHESRLEPVYKLAVGKSGSKLKESVGQGEPAVVPGPDGFVFRNMDMARFGGILSQLVARPVVDLTGLTGVYDFSLKFEEASSPEEQKRTTVEFFSSSIFSQIQKQHGLQLEADKAPVDYLIVDHVEEPAAN
jgi:uncharacterized protein (TIGR03435 family)